MKKAVSDAHLNENTFLCFGRNVLVQLHRNQLYSMLKWSQTFLDFFSVVYICLLNMVWFLYNNYVAE